MNINSLLRGYIDNNIKPKKEKNELISKYYNEISDLLEKKGYYTFRSGSYARGTAITPVNDLDIICECDEYDIDNFKNSIKGKGLYKILSDKYGEENINFQSSSIGISLGEEDGFGIDIVIALKINEFNNYGDNLYMVPKLLYSTRKERKENYKKIKTLKCGSENNLLIKSDPKGYKKELKQIKDNNNNIIYATRFLKKWKKVIKKEYFGENEKCLKSFHIEEAVKNIIKEFPEIKLFQLLGLTILMIDLDKANIADRADKTMMIDSYIGENNFNKVKNKKQLGDLYNNLSDITENNFISHMDKIFLGLHKKNIVQIKTIDKDYIKASIYKEVSVDATPFLVFKGLILFKVHYNKNKNNFSISEGLFLFSGGKDKINFRLNEMNYLIPQTKSDLVGAKNFYIHKDGNYPITRTYFENKYKNKDFSLVLEQYINSFFNKNTGYISF